MAYATASDLLDRKDWHTVADLATEDAQNPLTRTQTLNSAIVAAALDSASGAIDAALQQGGRYSPSDLAALTGNSLAYLKHLTCEIAMAYLFSRKPNYMIERYKAALDLHDAYLERLRKGENVFNVTENIEAGTPDYVAPLVTQIENLNLIRDRTRRFYPIRHDQTASG